MVEALGIALALATTFFIAQPFLARKQVELNFNGDGKIDELLARKKEVYSAIKDIEFDHEMGKLSGEDYQELRESYKVEAAQLIQRIEKIQNGAKRKTKKQKSASEKFCHNCGEKISAEDNFCVNCGTKQK
ncbi:zinc ribbon domain-containing protein [candidate division KSB1 bacterium]|nr:zinc ribbon domain-containing protein [candidate division KSB1 bacterium]